MVQRYIEQGWAVIEVIIHNKYATKIVDIVHELRDQGFVQGDDFEFAYYKAEYDGFNGESYNRHTIFRFKEPSVATWFSVKYNS
jgi:hypothetical protein